MRDRRIEIMGTGNPVKLIEGVRKAFDGRGLNLVA
jgi:hypothetical protein